MQSTIDGVVPLGGVTIVGQRRIVSFRHAVRLSVSTISSDVGSVAKEVKMLFVWLVGRSPSVISKPMQPRAQSKGPNFIAEWNVARDVCGVTDGGRGASSETAEGGEGATWCFDADAALLLLFVAS